MKSSGSSPTLLRELAEATLLARTPTFARLLSEAGLASDVYEVIGVANVVAGPSFYEPHEDGTPAVIVPAMEEGHLVDLVACAFASRQMRTRTGVARLLGYDRVVDCTFFEDETVEVFADPFAWLKGLCEGVVVIDWQLGLPLLRDLPGLRCTCRATLERLHEAFERPNPYPTLTLCKGD